MFKVENADFIADKLAAELLPDQEFREAYKNAEEAVTRRRTAEDAAGRLRTPGRIEFDIDWALHAQMGGWYLACCDDGDGMTRAEVERYTTTLAVTGANQNQSITGNQGMGLKISGPTRHRKGVLIRSLKEGQRSMVQIGWTGREYDLMALGDKGEVVVSVPEAFFPEFVLQRGSGTVVTFLGDRDDADTVVPDGRARNWLFKYLHQRFFRLDDDAAVLMVRQPAKDHSEWPHTSAEAGAGKGFNLARVYGTAHIWDDAADKLSTGRIDSAPMRGLVELPGSLAADVAAARMHWWVLPPPSSGGSDVSSRTAAGGSIAVLFQNELHDWRTSVQANPFFARLGVIFGKTRVAFVLEPQGPGVSSDFARAHVLVDGRPVFESEAWLTWADQFRERLPEAIKRTVADEQARLQEEDPDRARRIRERLKEVMQQLRPRKVRRHPDGLVAGRGPELTGPGIDAGDVVERTPGAGTHEPASRTPRGIGAALTQADSDDLEAEPANEVYALLNLKPVWVTEAQAEGQSLVEADGKGLRDRAAALAGEDGATASDLLLNREFRGYQMMLQTLNEWGNPDGDEDVSAAIETLTQEWVEQKMVEAITGLRQLENGSTWTLGSFNAALSPVALTAAFMADRYHTVREVRRQVGPMRQKRPTNATG